jgi:hypothetical protein
MKVTEPVPLEIHTGILGDIEILPAVVLIGVKAFEPIEPVMVIVGGVITVPETTKNPILVIINLVLV